MIEDIAILVSGVIVGCILFQSAINAPLIFTKLSIENARPLLRSIFPVMFKVMAGLGALLLTLALLGSLSAFAIVVGGMTLLGSIACAALVGRTNKAADEGNNTAFARLHRISVLLTMLVLIANIAWIFLM